MAGRSSRALAAVHKQSTRTPAAAPAPKAVPDAPEPAVSSAPGLTDHALHVGIVLHLGLDYLLGSALERIAEARRLTGDAYLAKIREARHLLDQAERAGR